MNFDHTNSTCGPIRSIIYMHLRCLMSDLMHNVSLASHETKTFHTFVVCPVPSQLDLLGMRNYQEIDLDHWRRTRNKYN